MNFREPLTHPDNEGARATTLFLLLVTFFFLVASLARGATYYVDADRPNDLGDGLSFAAAWKTIAKVNTASASFSPNDTVLFDAADEWAELLTPAASGSSGNYITFGRYGSSGRPTFRAATGRPSAVDLFGRTYIKLSFLNLVGGDAAEADGLLESTSITNLSEDCTFYGEGAADNCVGGSITLRRFYITGARDEGFTMHGTDTALLEDGEITGCTAGTNNSGTNMTLTINRCYIHDNGTGGEIGAMSLTTLTVNWSRIKGIYRLFDGSESPSTFDYCTFDGSASASAVAPEFNTTALTTANNCTYYGGGKGKMSIQFAAFNMVNCILANWNIAANLFTGGTFNKDHCITFNVTSGSVTSNTNAVTGDPLFVNAAAGDFRLQVGSPAINAGTNLGLTTDLAGRAVGNPPDIGAYEYFVGGNITSGNISVGTLSIGP